MPKEKRKDKEKKTQAAAPYPTSTGKVQAALSPEKPRRLSNNSESATTKTTLSSDPAEQQAAITKERETRFIFPQTISAAGQVLAPFVKLSVDVTHRPDTTLKGGEQGDHTTAYILIMEMLFAAVRGENIKDVPDILRNLAKCFLEKEHYQELDTFVDSFTASATAHVMTRVDRKQLTKEMRNSSSEFLKAHYEKTKSIIKEHEQLLLSAAVCQIGEMIISKHQQSPLAAMPKIRVENTEERPGHESTRVKKSMLHLKLLNHLIAFKQSSQPEALEDCQEIFDDIIRSSNASIQREDKVTEIFNEFLTNTGLPILGRKKTLKSLDAKWLDSIDLNNINLSAIAELFNGLFDFRYVATGDNNESYDELLKIAPKHIDCILTAFKQLHALAEDSKNKMVLGFAGALLKPINQGGQGWSACSI